MIQRNVFLLALSVLVFLKAFASEGSLTVEEFEEIAINEVINSMCFDNQEKNAECLLMEPEECSLVVKDFYSTCSSRVGGIVEHGSDLRVAEEFSECFSGKMNNYLSGKGVDIDAPC